MHLRRSGPTELAGRRRVWSSASAPPQNRWQPIAASSKPLAPVLYSRTRLTFNDCVSPGRMSTLDEYGRSPSFCTSIRCIPGASCTTRRLPPSGESQRSPSIVTVASGGCHAERQRSEIIFVGAPRRFTRRRWHAASFARPRLRIIPIRRSLGRLLPGRLRRRFLRGTRGERLENRLEVVILARPEERPLPICLIPLQVHGDLVFAGGHIEPLPRAVEIVPTPT